MLRILEPQNYILTPEPLRLHPNREKSDKHHQNGCILMKRLDRGRKKREKGNRMEWRREMMRRRGWWMSRGDGTEKKAKRKGKQLRARRKWWRRKTGREAGLGLGGQLHHPRSHGLKAHLPRSGVLGLIALHLEKKHAFNIQDKNTICICCRLHTPWDGSQVSEELWAGRS